MKPPPFLMLAVLLFWGWLSGFLVVGAAMGAVLEFSRWTKWRWQLDDADFNRIWSFCVLLNVALVAYVFTNNEAGGLNNLLHGNTAATAIHSSQLSTIRFMRWLPMTTFAFVLAQVFNERPTAPLTSISLVLRWRRRHGDQAFAGRFVNVTWPYFVICAFAAGVNANAGSRTYFFGLCLLVGWVLWTQRPKRYSIFVWSSALVAIAAIGFFGVFTINQAERGIQNLTAKIISRFFSQRADPLQSMTSMGRIGQLKLSARIVIWLEPREVGHMPEYLRESSYRNYQPNKMTWYAGGTLSDFENIQSETNGTTWALLPGKKNSEIVNIACYLNGWSREIQAPEGLLPLPSGSSVLENLPVLLLKANRNGAVMGAGPGLVMFDAHYGPGVSMDAPPDLQSTNRFDLVVPTNEIPALDQVLTELDLTTTANREDKLRAVQKFFFDKFTYSTWQGLDKKKSAESSPLTKFLTKSRSGHCEYFASATVLLLRHLDIPARYAVGYSVHEPRGAGYIVRERDAHAWCLVWNDATKCWEDFDTTPGSWVDVESERTSVGEWLANVRSWVGLQIAKFRWRQANLQQYVVWALIPVLFVLLWHIIFRRRKTQTVNAGKNKSADEMLWPGLDSEFYELEKKLSARGVPRQSSESLSDWLERALAEPSLKALREPIRNLLLLHYRHRFDPPGLTPEQREQLRQEARACLEALLQA